MYRVRKDETPAKSKPLNYCHSQEASDWNNSNTKTSCQVAGRRCPLLFVAVFTQLFWTVRTQFLMYVFSRSFDEILTLEFARFTGSRWWFVIAANVRVCVHMHTANSLQYSIYIHTQYTTFERDSRLEKIHIKWFKSRHGPFTYTFVNKNNRLFDAECVYKYIYIRAGSNVLDCS